MRLEDFDYRLPEAQIAQVPPPERDGARLLVVDRAGGSLSDRRFAEFPSLLRGDELLVFNNARVIPARLYARREATAGLSRRVPPASGAIEVFLSRQLSADVWEALVKPGKKVGVRTKLLFGSGELEGLVTARGEFGLRVIEFHSRDAQTVGAHFEALGHMPLPPYIDRADQAADRERYQTVFAKHPGAVAAPTAGLHFTPEILRAIRERGAEICELTLHVGLGTFQPIRSATLEEHTMHAESYVIPVETAERIAAAREAGRAILAVGTTVVRALEAAALRADSSPRAGSEQHSWLAAGSHEARLFIYPGFSFRVVDALLTNFHLPRSTLLALVSAFAGREQVLAAYRHAVTRGYRFYSYGDCMLLR
ncbi:MAG: tRNA preQ1(34) S-adenosylmethionine ribosyltransferase-isomerase QueA [Candidatus Acidiferrum sp.]|jgi:S-adenosylmethionine:tRNA ribosyltransferase-isomerase